jgi:peptidyl-Lys metalloendopeptidase
MPPNPYRELDLSSNGCQAGWFAYTYNGSMTIWLCGGFWSAPLTGIDSRSGTIVHELSHSVAGTQDIVYGTVNAQTLATNNPGQAVTNADNFEYFAESVPLLPVGPYDFAPRGQAESSVLSQFHR